MSEDNAQVRIGTDIFGYVKLESTQRYENGKIILGYKYKRYNGKNELIEEREGDTMSVGYDNMDMSHDEAIKFMEGE